MERRQAQTRIEDIGRVRSGGDGDDSAESLERLRRTERLLAAADEAINRALSADSEQFLRAARQTGGQ